VLAAKMDLREDFHLFEREEGVRKERKSVEAISEKREEKEESSWRLQSARES